MLLSNLFHIIMISLYDFSQIIFGNIQSYAIFIFAP
jgi:hypothetical protein